MFLIETDFVTGERSAWTAAATSNRQSSTTPSLEARYTPLSENQASQQLAAATDSAMDLLFTRAVWNIRPTTA